MKIKIRQKREKDTKRLIHTKNMNASDIKIRG